MKKIIAVALMLLMALVSAPGFAQAPYRLEAKLKVMNLEKSSRHVDLVTGMVSGLRLSDTAPSEVKAYLAGIEKDSNTIRLDVACQPDKLFLLDQFAAVKDKWQKNGLDCNVTVEFHSFASLIPGENGKTTLTAFLVDITPSAIDADASCKANCLELEEAARHYFKENPTKTSVDAKTLMESKCISIIPECPAGGTYEPIDSTTLRAVCTHHTNTGDTKK